MTSFYFRNPRLLALTIAMILVAGLSAFATIPRLEDPVILNRFATILTTLPGAGAKRVESLVTEKVAQGLRKSAEITKPGSASRNGRSSDAIVVPA